MMYSPLFFKKHVAFGATEVQVVPSTLSSESSRDEEDRLDTQSWSGAETVTDHESGDEEEAMLRQIRRPVLVRQNAQFGMRPASARRDHRRQGSSMDGVVPKTPSFPSQGSSLEGWV